MKSFDTLVGPAARAAMRDDRRIRAVISRIVPAAALGHVTFCRLAGRQLRVTVDSAAWVAKLRFTERALLAALVLDGLDVRTVSWHVTPAANPAGRETARRSARTASSRAAQAVLSAADAVGAARAGVTGEPGTAKDAPGGGTEGPTDGGSRTRPEAAGRGGGHDDDELVRQMRRMARNLTGGGAGGAPSED